MDDAEVILQSWVKALRPDHKSSEEIITIGIAMPGPFDYEQGISLMKGMQKYDSLYGMNIRQILAERLGIPGEHITFINDAEAFYAGELRFRSSFRF